jgi:tripartite-type tricarboxylate transporter receptor subunit TctC
MDPRPYDIVGDATPITKVAKFPLYLIIHPSIPAKTLTEFIAYAKSKSGALNFASSGQGGISHLAAELFNSATGIKAGHVPYKGGGPALQAVLMNEAQYLFNNIGLSQPHVAAGRLRGLAITGDKRSPALPEVATFAESGIRGMEGVYSWLGILGPAKLPAAIVTKVNAEVIRILHTPDFESRVQKDGYTVVANTPAQFAIEIQSDVETWSRVIKEKGIRAE